MSEMADKRLLAFITLSVLAHLVLLIVSQAEMQQPSKPRTLTLSGVVTVQIASNSSINTRETERKTQGKRQQHEKVRTSPTRNRSLPVLSRVKEQEKTRQQDKAVVSQGTNQNSNLSELQRLLLAEINLHKHYPLSALRMGQQGTARVGFRLRKNGYIDALAVLRSSGHDSLDRAALSAINNIQPFAPADRLLTTTADLQIDIVFQL
jgi:protein TonB